MAWTDERVELLKKLWADGLSASQIAARLGGVTRNAVIGKVHRLGLSGRATTTRVKTAARPRPRKRTTQAPRAPRSIFGSTGSLALSGLPEFESEQHFEEEPDPIPELHVVSSEKVTILNLTEHTCKWPIGDPSDENFRFCGCKTQAGSPYCEHHARIAYQTLPQRRRLKVASAG